MVTSDFSPEAEIWPFHACTLHPAIIIGTVRSPWTRLWGIYRVPQNAFLVGNNLQLLENYSRQTEFSLLDCVCIPFSAVKKNNSSKISP